MSRITSAAENVQCDRPSMPDRGRTLSQTRLRRCAAAAALLLVTSTPGFGAEAAADSIQYPEEVILARPGFSPEAIAFDPIGGHLLVGAMREPKVFTVMPDGTMTPLVDDPDLVSVIGMEVDTQRNRLLVCNSDLAALNGARGQAKLGIYALDTGDRVAMVELTGALPFGAENFFPNDVAVADDGTAYITDSAARLIYVVSPTLEVSAIAPSRFLNYPVFFLNGIVTHPDGYLLVGEMRQGQLLKISLDGSEQAQQVRLPETLVGVDGITWRGPDELVTVSNETNRVSILRSQDNWISAEIVAQTTLDKMASTAAVVHGEVHVLHPHFDAKDTPTQYEIARVVLDTRGAN